MCNEAGIAGGSWPASTADAPVLLGYKIEDIEEFLHELGNNVSLSVSAGKKAYIRELESRVTWTWDVGGIGGNCNTSAAKQGTLQLQPGTAQVASLCNNGGCNITLTCTKAPDGSLSVSHHGCGSDVYNGAAVTAGCSIVAPFGKVDRSAGQCCMY